MQEINDTVREKTQKKVCESKNGKAVDFACCLYYNIYNKRMAPKTGRIFMNCFKFANVSKRIRTCHDFSAVKNNMIE